MKKIVVFALLTSVLFVGCQQTPASKTVSNNSDTSTNNSNKPNMETAKVTPANPLQKQGPQKGDTVASIETDMGVIKFRLFPTLSPETSKNFVELTNSGKFDNVPFHRVIQGFMIQTGDFTNKNGTGGYSYKGVGTKIDDELSPDLSNLKGTVSMANAGPNTNGSQFFIVTADQGTPHLDGHYSVFGQVYEGQDIADAISKVKTGPMDNPLTPINMKKVTISTF